MTLHYKAKEPNGEWSDFSGYFKTKHEARVWYVKEVQYLKRRGIEVALFDGTKKIEGLAKFERV